MKNWKYKNKTIQDWSRTEPCKENQRSHLWAQTSDWTENVILFQTTFPIDSGQCSVNILMDKALTFHLVPISILVCPYILSIWNLLFLVLLHQKLLLRCRKQSMSEQIITEWKRSYAWTLWCAMSYQQNMNKNKRSKTLFTSHLESISHVR